MSMVSRSRKRTDAISIFQNPISTNNKYMKIMMRHHIWIFYLKCLQFSCKAETAKKTVVILLWLVFMLNMDADFILLKTNMVIVTIS